MYNEQESRSRIDDVPFEFPVELEDMNENDWVLLKLKLQVLLFRAEQAQNPDQSGGTIIDWIARTSDKFDRFYKALRKESPRTLLAWRGALEAGGEEPPTFMAEWTAFRD